RREESAPNPIALDAASEAVVAKPALNLLRTFLTGAQICRRQLQQACDADRGGTPRSLWIPTAHLKPKSPNAQAPAPRVFHLNPHALAPRIFHLDGYALQHYALEHYALEQAVAPRVFHLNYHAIRQALAPDRFVSGLKSGWRELRDADCPILAD